MSDKALPLIVRMCDSHYGKVPMICWADGEALPGQLQVTLDAVTGDLPSITVRFIIDGKGIAIT